MMFAPLAQTPGDRESGNAMRRYTEQVTEALDALAPWTTDRDSKFGERSVRGVKSGEVKVILDPGDTLDHPVLKNAEVVR